MSRGTDGAAGEPTSTPTRPPIEGEGMRIGRTDLGCATVVIDDEALTIVLVSPSEGRPIRVPFALLDVVVPSDASDELTMIMRDGTRVTLTTAAAPRLLDDILWRCGALPELTRTL